MDDKMYGLWNLGAAKHNIEQACLSVEGRSPTHGSI